MVKPLRVVPYLLLLTLYSRPITQAAEFPILDASGLELRNARAETTIHLGMPALTLLAISNKEEGEPAYGSNAAAGHYVQTPDAKIYYERYGEMAGRLFCCTVASMVISTSSAISFVK